VVAAQRGHVGASLTATGHHEAGKITGSASGATPNAADIKANAIRMIEAQTPKTASEEFSRIEEETLLFRGRPEVVDAVSCIAMNEYKAVGKNKAMSISKSIRSNHDLVAG
jgi:hypothetical protein